MKYAIKNLSDACLHPDYRWDGEYFCFEPYKNKNLKYIPIGDIVSYSQYGLSISMNEEKIGTKIYRMNEIHNMLCDREVFKYAKIEADKIKAYKLKDKDILFNRTNSFKFVGRTGLFRKFSDEPIVFASYLVRIRPKSETITPEYLTVFLNTKYGARDIKRRARSSINQSNVNPEELKRAEIPLLSNELQKQISALFDKSFKFLKESELKYKQARSLLLEELELTDWRPKHQLSFIKRYSDTERAGRMDAECFQPKYEEIVRKIKAYKGGQDRLGNLTEMKQGVEPGKKEYSEEGVPFVRVSDLKPEEIRKGKCISNQLHSQLKEYQPQTGEILLTKDGSPCTAHHFIDDAKKMIIASGILRLQNKSKKINAVCLTLILNSILVKEQMRRDASGFVILHWKPEQIKETLIPILSEEKQVHIQKTVTESLNLRKKSKKLLQASVQAVEKAIEQDEKIRPCPAENRTF